MRVLHFSDPHVQLPRWRERKLRELGPLRAVATVELWKGRGRDYDDALDNLRQIVRDAGTLKADFVVCTGDLTQLAMEEEFSLAREALEPVAERLVCIHGNHDRYPLNLKGAHNRLYEQYFPRRPLPEPFLAVDSCGDLCWPVFTQGRVAPEDLRQDFTGRVVLVHHAPVRDWPWHELRGRRAFLDRTATATAVLCGHKHERQNFGNVFCAGSSTERGKEGYWLLDFDGTRLTATRRRLGGAIESPAGSPAPPEAPGA